MKSEMRRLILEQQLDDLGYGPVQRGEFVSLEAAGLEEDTRQQPQFGNTDNPLTVDCCKGHYEGGVMELIMWATDGEDSRYEMN